MYSGYDPERIRAEMKQRYNTPDDTTYVSVYLTYQPPMNTKDMNPNAEQLPIYVKWFANGAATKKMYLTCPTESSTSPITIRRHISPRRTQS